MSDPEARPRILVVEDEKALREGLLDLLAFHGWSPSAAETGEEGLGIALRDEPDLVLLDVMLPGLSGFDVCERLRAARPSIAILMLTAKGSEEDVVRGLRCGADDYVTKPFSLRELVARVEALLRRARSSDEAEEPEPETFRVGDWTVDPTSYTASTAATELSLTPRELAILLRLAREPGRVVSRRVFLRDVWELQNVDEIETRTVDVHLAKLRRKLGDSGRRAILTVRGAGYRLVS